MNRRGAESWARRAQDKATALGEFSADARHPLGLSIGIAIFRPGSRESADALIARADRAMYDGKRQGKGAVILAEPAPAQPTQGAA